MKKSIFLFIIAFVVCIPFSVNAESIRDYRNRIAAIEKEKAEANSKSAAVQERINNAQARINEITNQIEQARRVQEQTKAEIKKLDKEIESKKEEIKDLVAFYQVSDNDNFYLKFIFGADSFEDFIYRFSIAEQLTEANDELVDEMHDLIEENKQKIKELETQKKKLSELNNEISKEIDKLGSQKRKYSENALNADEEIEALEKQIAFFKKEGCSETQDVTRCSGGIAPSALGFILPLTHGYVTSYYGGRIHPITHTASHHDGIDIAKPTGTKVMASNSGKVILADWYYGFGKAIMIVHNISGKGTYTTLYGHLSKYSVRSGQTVTRGQKIGEVGSTGNSTGPHLHFQTMYGSGYGTTFNPEDLFGGNIPVSW